VFAGWPDLCRHGERAGPRLTPGWREEQDMDDEGSAARESLKFDAGFKELEIVAYIGEFKIVGVAHFGVGSRASSRRASDYIRAFSDARLTLSQVRIYSKATKELLDTAPFILLNMDKVDFIYARDDDEGRAPE
jgi:hypothetical protein